MYLSSLNQIKFPNVRKLFIPDPDHVIIDCDLSGADAQVVAWEAEDEDLMKAFQSGIKIHVKNIEDMWGRPFRPSDKTDVVRGHNYTPYDEIKRAVHGTNYGASARTLAITLGWTINEAERFQSKWFTLHPKIKEWHRRIEREVQTARRVSNKFGYRRVYFDRPDGLLPEALAWIPQSTIGLLAARASVNLDDALPVKSLFDGVLLQVHDSVVFQIRKDNFTPRTLQTIKNLIHLPIPYPTPLTIPWEIAASDKSWGDVTKINWDGSNINEALQKLD